MEFEYSPRHSANSAPHLLSPTHAHVSPVDKFASIKQIRRSLSRSPSKPQRFMLTTSPIAPRSMSNLSRAFTADNTSDLASKSKHSAKRTGPLRTSSRRTSPNSPLRRALSDNTNQANAKPQLFERILAGRSRGDQENMECSSEEAVKHSRETRFDEPIKIDFLKPDKLLQPVLKEHASPMKSSPLKRSDGVMNLEAASFGSPRHKRRSLHGATSFGSDFNVFEHGLDGTNSDSAESGRSSEEKEREAAPGFSSTWPTSTTSSPQRRPFSLRKSTLQQRAGPGRSRLFPEANRESIMSPALTRARSRISLDSALPFRSLDFESPFRRTSVNEPPVFFQPPAQKLYQSAPKPHPLSHALTPSSSSSSVVDNLSQQSQQSRQAKSPETEFVKPPSTFSRSLPVGALRTGASCNIASSETSSQESFATPAGYKMAKPLPQAFHSTGLISKRNRNVDFGASTASAHMPDTPSKKAAHIHITSTPSQQSALGKLVQPVHEFGSPSTPLNARNSKVSPESFGKGVNIFGSRAGAPQLTRRGSFLSVDGDDLNNSPTHRLQSQSSNDDLPPTPTKSTSATALPRPQSKGKSNSLRSSLFGRRTSLDQDGPEKQSPHTPQESFTPPDPSSLSISAEQRPSTAFGGRSAKGFQVPATPTGPRGDHAFASTYGTGHASSGYFANDVDTTLTSRFAHVTTSGIGEFSQVYRVEKPLPGAKTGSQTQLSPGAQVWAVKKARKPYTGNKDRARKMREVQILEALRNHEHIVELVDFWEAKNHLYIQTEFCENGNLKDFLLHTGYKGRLDDFRIWKILLELSQGVKSIHDATFIHLDLKPANIFIDWEGVLKIGDFGMASVWPAPPGLDGEGDREYIGPEVLWGRFDKPADIFALGMIMLETAGNIVLPDNGASWQRLRAGDLSDLPSLTWTSDSSLVRDESGDPVEMVGGMSNDSMTCSVQAEDDLDFLRPAIRGHRRKNSRDLVTPPNFMVDQSDKDALDQVVQWMISPDPDSRPTVDQLLMAGGVQWVERRRRAGATVYEGSWGPADVVVDSQHQDIEMMDI
ncbi:hypothetical protein M433DRAFT_60345 [Acidomyces richmondensis BFW]|nr:MAG: hypothetical protein FE78DRAFT_143368 [Acidomyces sp. 'richmondensis']KYG48817.1 hypothetical protein M433DRAFT_60345 [Acidomyces richmondensis BFW]